MRKGKFCENPLQELVYNSELGSASYGLKVRETWVGDKYILVDFLNKNDL